MPPRPLKVFLCHAHADRDAVHALYTRLTNDGVDAWLDKEKLLGGQNWRMEIRNAVEEADVVVVCHSKEFNKEGFRQREVRWALDAAMEKPEGTIFIIPARLEECKVIKSLSDWHWVDLFENNGYEMLMRALRARANDIGTTLHIKKNDIENPQKEKPTAPKPKKEFQLPKNLNRNLMGGFGFIVLVMVSILGLPSLFNSPVEVPSPTQTENVVVLDTQIPKPSSTPSITSIPTNTKAPIFTATPTPLQTEITDAKGVTMMLVSGNEFPSFYMDKYEVTNALYKICVDSGICLPPTNANRFVLEEYSNHPVVYIKYDMAVNYCAWRESRLPTVKNWENAATFDLNFEGGKPYCNYANAAYGSYYEQVCVDTTMPVGSYELGKSIFNIYDLIGNVAEWAQNDFIESYADWLDTVGGSWGDYLPGTDRITASENPSSNRIGFRCIRDPIP